MCDPARIPDFERKKETLYQCLSTAGASSGVSFIFDILGQGPKPELDDCGRWAGGEAHLRTAFVAPGNLQPALEFGKAVLDHMTMPLERIIMGYQRQLVPP